MAQRGARVSGRPASGELFAARRRMLTTGMDHDQIAAVFTLVYPGLRVRAAYRYAQGWTQEQAAEQINLHRPGGGGTVWASQVSEYEAWPDRGRQPPVGHLRLMALAYRTEVRCLLDDRDLARLPQRVVNLLSEPTEDPSAPRAGGGGPAGRVAEDLRCRPGRERGCSGQEGASRTLEVLGDWDDLMRRRTVLAASGTSAVGWLASPGGAGRTPGEVFAAHARITAEYRRLDNLLGAGAVYQQAAAHHQWLRAWLRAASAADRPGVVGLAADSGSLMGWLNVDLEQYAEAGAYYREAADAACGDPGRYAYLVSRLGLVLLDCGRYREGARFTAAARDVPGPVHPVVRAWTASTDAYARACLREDRACRLGLDAAQRYLEQAESAGGPPPDCAGFFDAVHLHKWTGRTLVRLGDGKLTGRARAALDQSADGWAADFVRGSAEVWAECADARIVQGEVGEAARLARRAHDVAVRTGSRRNHSRVLAVRARLAPYSRTAAVRELNDYLLSAGGSHHG